MIIYIYRLIYILFQILRNILQNCNLLQIILLKYIILSFYLFDFHYLVKIQKDFLKYIHLFKFRINLFINFCTNYPIV